MSGNPSPIVYARKSKPRVDVDEVAAQRNGISEQSSEMESHEMETETPTNGFEMAEIKKEPVSPDPEPSARIQRKRNRPKWMTENFMDYEISYVVMNTTVTKSNRSSGPRKSSTETVAKEPVVKENSRVETKVSPSSSSSSPSKLESKVLPPSSTPSPNKLEAEVLPPSVSATATQNKVESNDLPPLLSSMPSKLETKVFPQSTNSKRRKLKKKGVPRSTNSFPIKLEIETKVVAPSITSDSSKIETKVVPPLMNSDSDASKLETKVVPTSASSSPSKPETEPERVGQAESVKDSHILLSYITLASPTKDSNDLPPVVKPIELTEKPAIIDVPQPSEIPLINGVDEDPVVEVKRTKFMGMPKLLNQRQRTPPPPVDIVGDPDDEDSNSEDEEYSGYLNHLPVTGSRRNSMDPYIKDEAIRFLANKISNRNMLRVRQELMALKKSGNYFKLTKTAPLAAGLIHDMFCQSLDPTTEDFQ